MSEALEIGVQDLIVEHVEDDAVPSQDACRLGGLMEHIVTLQAWVRGFIAVRAVGHFRSVLSCPSVQDRACRHVVARGMYVRTCPAVHDLFLRRMRRLRRGRR